jgi:hypothetical protein
MKNGLFGANKVIIEPISEAHLRTYFVGFDSDDNGNRYYRWEPLVNLLQNVIPEFAFAHHVAINKLNAVERVREAARAIYKIKEFDDARLIYENGGFIADDDETKKAKKKLERGEFGELILHLLLRDYCETVPLLSKIFFKDSFGSAVHGFDAVHIEPQTKTLWLGESKLYINGKKGIKSLIEDIKGHFNMDYLHDEFSIVTRKVESDQTNIIKDRDYWIDLMDKNTKLDDLFKSVKIPLLCTYTSKNFSKYDDENLQEFICDYQEEVQNLKQYFDDNCKPSRTDLDIILLLFPVKCKNELVFRMHKKLYSLQNI